jgi:hypothetical protein
MGFNWVCVCLRVSTFSSDLDERVFLCLPHAVTSEVYEYDAVRTR